MAEKTKQFSQLYDDGIRDGIIGEIGHDVFLLLVAISPYINKAGQCYPSRFSIAKNLGVSIRTVSERIAMARKASYRGVPVLMVRQKKERVGGKWKCGSNEYTISGILRERLLDRYSSAGKNMYTEDSKENKGKNALPRAEMPHAEKLPANDSHSVKDISYNDKKKSLIEKFSFKAIPVMGFEMRADTPDKQRCLDIAIWLGEENMNFILNALYSKHCGIDGIEWAFGMVKEDYEKYKARNKRKLFNFYIQQYKKERASS